MTRFSESIGRLGGLLAFVLAGQSLMAGGLATEVQYFHVDGLGSVRAMTDENGELVADETRNYLAFGEEWCGTAPCSGVTAGQPKRYTGKERDGETGLDYFGARYYRPGIARFTSVDPAMTTGKNLLNPQRWNRYAYGLNSPLTFVDPDGEDAVWVNHADGTSTLVIPVNISGAGVTEDTKTAILDRANGITVPDPKVTIKFVFTDKPVNGKLNNLDFSPGLDKRMCGEIGECTNRVGGNRAHINSSRSDATGAATHEIFHFAGIGDGYKDGPTDAQGNRTRILKKGYTDSHIMASTSGTELKEKELKRANKNRSTRKCDGSGSECQ